MARPATLFGKPKPKADLGAPAGFGPPPKARTAPPPAADPDQDQDIDTGSPDMDPDQVQDSGSAPTVSPEAVSYRTADQQCNSCEYMGDDGSCAVLKMPVGESDGCNAHKPRGGDQSGDGQPQMETRGRLRGDYGGRDMGDMGG